jgi:hypothetical protein
MKKDPCKKCVCTGCQKSAQAGDGIHGDGCQRCQECDEDKRTLVYCAESVPVAEKGAAFQW